MSGLFLLRMIRDRSFEVADAAVEAGEKSGGFIGDHSGFEIRAGKIANGIQRAPGGLDENFSFIVDVPNEDRSALISIHVAKFGQDVFGKVIQILGQVRLGGPRRPMPHDCSR